MTTRQAYVIGHPIGHSRSPMMHGYWLRRYGIDARYDKLDVPPDQLSAFFQRFRDERLIGCNVTIPHKLAVMDQVDRIDDAAKAMGAVNCIWWEGDTLVGGNTDALGFLGNLDDLAPGWDKGATLALVIGAGGAARAAVYGFLSRGLKVAIANRTLAKAQALAEHFGKGVTAHELDDLPGLLAQADVVANVTSLGMVGQPPLQIDLGALKDTAVVCDAVYVPLETALVKAARARGLRAVDGLGMLLHQGVEGFDRWFGTRPEVTAELRKLLEDDIREKTPGA
jgi:shikimate dehydrogenase